MKKKIARITTAALVLVMAMSMLSFAGTIPDGIYKVGAKTDNSMFAINAADNNTAVLTVRKGKQSVRFRLRSTGFDYLYKGTAEQAKADETGWIPHEQVNSKDAEGFDMVSYYFTMPVALNTGDNEFKVAARSAKRLTWYDHAMTFTWNGTEKNLAPVKVKIKSLKSSKKKSAKLVWKKASRNCQGYEIQYSQKKSMKKASVISISKAKTTTKTIKKLKSKKKYYVRVRTVNKVNDTVFYSGWSAKKSVRVK